jgi:hypothetical protein
MTNSEKGKRLEEAVKIIESAIIRSSSLYSEASFQIESNKIIIANGVRHEIDLWVKARIATGYESIFIFECKNRLEKVSKNDIIVFSEKVKVTNASCGFFIGKAFAKDAVAQIALDPRLKSLVATELDPSSLLVPQIAPRVRLEDESFYVGVLTRRGYPLPRYSESLPFALRNERMRVGQFVGQLRREAEQLYPFTTLATGDYPFILEAEKAFEKYEALLAGVEIASLSILVEGVAIVERATLVSAFDVQSRGRTIRYAFASPVVIPGRAIVEIGPIDLTFTSSNP